ncbi:cytochrome P450 [Micromonospora zingiberis]|uniref:cytochrome P450 n=1 Tax=Micromonospora zingiberis TaxID=2053011 RepID=UPI001F0D2D6A|nr:cytochrome P450 [Micromonospora zingiberis]
MFRSWEQAPAATEGARAGSGVARVADHVGTEHLLVTRHALVRQVLTDPQTYRPDNALDAVTPMPVAALRVLAAHRFRLPPTLANNGGASHPGLRAMVADALHPKRVADQRDWLAALVRQRVATLTETLDTGTPVDLYADLAADLPLLVLARLVELPDAPVAAVKNFARAALELFWAPLDADRQQALAAEVGRFHRVLREFAATGGGLAGSLRAAGHPPDVVVGALFFLLVAGQETTSQFLTLLMHRLTGEPAVLAGLRDGSVAAADVVEEGLRLEPPIVTWRRVAAVDTTLGGTAVAAGTSIVLWLARAGRDPAVVEVPDGFRPGQRGSRRHLAFGAGAHRCVGDHLARMEAATVVTETASLLAGVRVLRAPWCPDNLTFRMPDTFLVRR